MRRRAFTVIELLVVIGIIGMLIAILLPALEKVRHKGYMAACASNLREIGNACHLYISQNKGHLPRTTYIPDAPLVFGTGAASDNPFDSATGPQPNDVTAAFFLLAHNYNLNLRVFNCPYNDVYVYEPDTHDPRKRANFSDYHEQLGYSLADPYPSRAAELAGYSWNDKLNEQFPLAADKNPGTVGKNDNVIFNTTNPTPQQVKSATSNNHEKDGQNVLYADGHVAWQQSPFCGYNGDNIYCNKVGKIDQSPVDKADSLLLPTDDP